MNSALYSGWIAHRRFAPKAHAFRYRIGLLYLDLSEQDEVLGLSPLAGTSRLAPFGFRQQDYLREFTRHGMSLSEHRELLVLGFVRDHATHGYALAEALENGPVVLFFFPAAFTSGCEAQAASFAESIAEFEALGAQVIGVTAGNTDRLADFSTQHCASAFPVFATADGMIGDYEAGLLVRPGWTSRTTYVIATDQTIALTYSEMSPYEHVDRSLAALREMLGDSAE